MKNIRKFEGVKLLVTQIINTQMRKFIFSGLFIFTSCLLVFLLSCKSGNNKLSSTSTADSIMSDTSFLDTLSLEEMKAGLPIFYNMYLSVDMTRLFESAGASFSPEILNPVLKEKDYNTSSEKALNLGVFSVDLGYIRAYEQYEKTRAYFDAMRNLSSSLGIPEDFFLKSAERYDKNITNKDSLVKIANEVYSKTSLYLKDNERESAAALIVVGGWVEAVYIATKMVNYSARDIELIEKIADQKVSIKSLIDMADIYKEDTEISHLLTKLEDLKISFDKFSVNPSNIKPSLLILKEVSAKISKLRASIVQ